MVIFWLLACVSTSAPTEAPSGQPTGTIGGAPILEAPVILGGIENSAIEEALDMSAIRACNRAGRPGKVLVRFQLKRDGQVDNVETRSTTLRHPPTETCIHKRLQATGFPPLNRGEKAIVTWTFTL